MVNTIQVVAVSLLAVSFVSAQPVTAQCPTDSARVVTGRVFDFETAAPLSGALVFSTVPGCGVLADAQGRFRIDVSAVRGDTLTFVVIGYDDRSLVLRPSLDSLDLGISLPISAFGSSVDDFSAIDDRPQALANPEGLAGCYWIGGGPWARRIVQLNLSMSGAFQGLKEEGIRWSVSPDSTSVVLYESITIDAGRYAPIRIGKEPNWSFLPMTFTEWHMFQEDVIETFAVRVACGGGEGG